MQCTLPSLRCACLQTHKLLSRDEEQVLSKYFVAFRQYEIVSDALHTQNRQQPSDEVGLPASCPSSISYLAAVLLRLTLSCTAIKLLQCGVCHPLSPATVPCTCTRVALHITPARAHSPPRSTNVRQMCLQAVTCRTGRMPAALQSTGRRSW